MGDYAIISISRKQVSAVWIAALVPRAARGAKVISRGCAPVNSTTCARAVSITPLGFDPNL
jgi:hypothetical protein